jgi:hydroxypyruvate reductase
MTHFQTEHLRVGTPDQREAVLRVMDAALDAVDPGEAMRRHVRVDADILSAGGQRIALDEVERVWVIGGGKAAAPMARALEDILGGRIAGGLVITRHGYRMKHGEGVIEVVEAGHPIPDEAGVMGAGRLLEIAEGAGECDLVLCLISGGGSALMPAPVEGVTLAEMQALTDDLLRSGANINAINAVRKHLSRIKGGRLARAAHPAQVIALILSDVVGSPLDVIASGPTAPDSRTFADARAVLDCYDVQPSDSIVRVLKAAREETPKPGDPAFERVTNVVIGDNAAAARAALAEAESLGFHALLLSTYMQGEAREVGRVLAAVAREIDRSGRPVPRPACVIAGGETTVTVTGQGTGGRNQEVALSAAADIGGLEGVIVASLATDGADGPTDAAGALTDGTFARRADENGLSIQGALADNDAYPLLEKLGALLLTGPTRTNVNDLAFIFAF